MTVEVLQAHRALAAQLDRTARTARSLLAQGEKLGGVVQSLALASVMLADRIRSLEDYLGPVATAKRPAAKPPK